MLRKPLTGFLKCGLNYFKFGYKRGLTISEIVKGIGRKIRSVRKERGLTLKQVGDRLHVTASLISQLERGVTNPSISLLKEMSDCLAIPVASLIESGETRNTNYPLLRDGERKTLTIEGNTRFELLSQLYDLNCEFILNEWAPGASSGRTKYAHEGFECGFVLKGKLIIEMGDQIYELKSGASITFPSTTPHLIRNPTKKMTIAVWVNSIPWIFKNR